MPTREVAALADFEAEAAGSSKQPQKPAETPREVSGKRPRPSTPSTPFHQARDAFLAEAEELLREGLYGARVVYGEAHLEALISSSNLGAVL